MLRSMLMVMHRGPFIYSYVVQYLSWRLGFWFIDIACGLLFVGVFFFVPEVSRPLHLSPT